LGASNVYDECQVSEYLEMFVYMDKIKQDAKTAMFPKEITSKYTILNRLGEGGFGVVRQIIDKASLNCNKNIE
ncbi:hypothetical protein L9F63_005405, partial [Diploptera punctata]